MKRMLVLLVACIAIVSGCAARNSNAIRSDYANRTGGEQRHRQRSVPATGEVTLENGVARVGFRPELPTKLGRPLKVYVVPGSEGDGLLIAYSESVTLTVYPKPGGRRAEVQDRLSKGELREIIVRGASVTAEDAGTFVTPVRGSEAYPSSLLWYRGGLEYFLSRQGGSADSLLPIAESFK